MDDVAGIAGEGGLSRRGLFTAGGVLALLVAAGVDVGALAASATEIGYSRPTNPYRAPGTYSSAQLFGAPRDYGGHKGADYDSTAAAAADVPIYNIADGNVQYTYWSDGTGNCVMVLNDDGVYARYCHLKYPVTASGRVSRGQVIGIMGATGTQQEGRHLHLELAFTPTAAGTYNFDPVAYIDARLNGAPSAQNGDSDMLMIHYPTGSTFQLALFGPGFWYEWNDVPNGALAVGFIKQIAPAGVGSVPVTVAQYNSLRVAAIGA